MTKKINSSMRLKVQLFVCVGLMAFGCSSPDKKSDNAAAEGVAALAPEAFKENFASASNPVLIDVRTPAEVQEGIIPGAVNIDIKDSLFTDKIKELDKNNTYFLYCKAGKRSNDAARQMEQMGFKNISVLEGGITEWKAKGLETVPPK